MAAVAADGKDYDVVVVGSFVYDLVAYADRLPRPGESLIGSSFTTGFGGKGCNQAVMAHFLGSRCVMAGCLGDDTFGEEYKRHLEKEGIQVVLKPSPPGVRTGVAFITVTTGGQNQIVVLVGANNALTPDDVLNPDSAMHRAIAAARVVVCQFEVPLPVVEATLQVARRSGAIAVLNPAPMPEDVSVVPASVFRLAHIACPNEVEAALWSGAKLEEGTPVKEVAERCVSKMLEAGCSLPMVTLGSEGALVCDAELVRHLVPAPQVKAVDTTGAGDCFVGSLAHYLAAAVRRGEDALSSESLLLAVKRAVRLAAVSVTRGGTQTSFPRGEEVAAALAEVKEAM